MAAGPSKSLSTKSLNGDEEYHEYCENFEFSGNVNKKIVLFKIQMIKLYLI